MLKKKIHFDKSFFSVLEGFYQTHLNFFGGHFFNIHVKCSFYYLNFLKQKCSDIDKQRNI